MKNLKENDLIREQSCDYTTTLFSVFPVNLHPWILPPAVSHQTKGQAWGIRQPWKKRKGWMDGWEGGVGGVRNKEDRLKKGKREKWVKERWRRFWKRETYSIKKRKRQSLGLEASPSVTPPWSILKLDINHVWINKSLLCGSVQGRISTGVQRRCPKPWCS